MIRTNYDYTNWIELITYLTVFFLIVVTPAILYVHYVFFPALNGHVDLLTFMNDDGFIDRFGEHIRDRIETNDITTDEFYSAFFSLFSAMIAPILLIFPLIYLINWFTIIGNWFTKKIGIMPMLQLAIIRNGKSRIILRFKQ